MLAGEFGNAFHPVEMSPAFGFGGAGPTGFTNARIPISELPIRAPAKLPYPPVQQTTAKTVLALTVPGTDTIIGSSKLPAPPIPLPPLVTVLPGTSENPSAISQIGFS